MVHRSLPSQVTSNDIGWDPNSQNVLTNAGSTTFLPEGVNLSSARIVARKGRDLATMQATFTLIINFADNPNGRDSYEQSGESEPINQAKSGVVVE